MSSVATFFVFVLVMLALAALAIILDWMGKPIRRSFRPRTTGTPAWLLADVTGTPAPSAPPYLPDPAQAPAQDGSPPDAARMLAQASEDPPSGSPVPGADSPLPGHAAPDPGSRPEATPEPGPWQAGESIFKLTPRGTPPSITAVRRRYWKNLSERRSSVVFGADNQALMAIGKAPQRFNPRTGTTEELDLPEPMLRHCWANHRRPTPTWGDEGLDPFRRP
ncbi:hypothetical protein [Candidatus Poriferisocius sp.]|uniref:hypothetical protein n=1 Tax=Candidatus Poriferisocius sp. TaxID=3101276 RepID=UPI003B5A2C7D